MAEIYPFELRNLEEHSFIGGKDTSLPYIYCIKCGLAAIKVRQKDGTFKLWTSSNLTCIERQVKDIIE